MSDSKPSEKNPAMPQLVKNCTLGMSRTQDVMKLIPHNDDGLAEILGVFAATLIELVERMEKPMDEICSLVQAMMTDD